MCSLAVAEDIHPVVTPAPQLGRESSSEQPSGHREAATRCARVSPRCTGTLGEEVEESRQRPAKTRAQGWSNPVGQDDTLVPAARQLPAQGEETH